MENSLQQNGDETAPNRLGAAAHSTQAASEISFQSLILNISREAIIGTDAHFVVRFCNQSAADLFNLPVSSAVARDIFDLLQPTRGDALRFEIERNGSGQAHIPVSTNPNQVRVIDVGAAACRGEDGQTVGYSFSFHDVTEHISPVYRQAIEAERAMLEKILEQLPSGVIIVEAPGGAIMRVNQAVLEMFRGQFTFSENILEYSDWVGFTTEGVQYRPEDWPVARSILTGEVVVNEEIIFPFSEEDLRTISISSAPVRDSNGKIIAGVAVVEDITDQKKADEYLRNSERSLQVIAERFRASVESLLDGFAILSAIRDESGKIIDFRYEYVNETGCKMNNRTYDHQVGRTLLELLPAHKENGLFERYVQLIETGEPLEVIDDDYEDLYGGGKRLRRTFEVRAVKLGDGFVVTWRDITQRKRTEEKLKTYAARLKQSNQELDQFALIASHDLQEPLRKIRMFSSSLRRTLGADLPEEGEDMLARMQRAVERMQSMIDGLLELSRVHTRGGKFEPTNLTRLVEEVISDLEPRLEASHGKILYEPLPAAEVDPGQFRRLLTNLIGNALKYHREGVAPVVELRGTLLEADNSTPTRLSLTITDNGIGFDEQEATRIFQPFQRLHGINEYEGTGMGLAICQKIIERHHGKIEVCSRQNEGSTFTVIIPIQHR